MRPDSERAGGIGVGDRLATSGNSTLVNRNVTIGGRRTSLRLEQAMWDAVAEICRREELSVGQLCQRVDERRRESTLTAALRVYVLSYFKAAATEQGHAAAGHGTFCRCR
jgi:predicted DNA-binding ribbon-helix-helix protein